MTSPTECSVIAVDFEATVCRWSRQYLDSRVVVSTRETIDEGALPRHQEYQEVFRLPSVATKAPAAWMKTEVLTSIGHQTNSIHSRVDH